MYLNIADGAIKTSLFRLVVTCHWDFFIVHCIHNYTDEQWKSPTTELESLKKSYRHLNSWLCYISVFSLSVLFVVTYNDVQACEFCHQDVRRPKSIMVVHYLLAVNNDRDQLPYLTIFGIYHTTKYHGITYNIFYGEKTVHKRNAIGN